MIKPIVKLNHLEKTVIEVLTQKQAKELMRVFESGGLRWRDGFLPTAHNLWEDYGKETCVEAGSDISKNLREKFGYAPKGFYLEKGRNIIEYEDFYKTQPDVTPDKRKEINAYFNWKEQQQEFPKPFVYFRDPSD